MVLCCEVLVPRKVKIPQVGGEGLISSSLRFLTIEAFDIFSRVFCLGWLRVFGTCSAEIHERCGFGGKTETRHS